VLEGNTTTVSRFDRKPQATNSINGLAAAGQLSFHVILGELVPNSLRGPVNAFVLFTSVPFAVFGPPVARAFYENTALQWRWSYILGVIVNALAVLLYFFFYHPPTYVSATSLPLPESQTVQLTRTRKCST
jgi:MFS family permease